MAVLGLSGCIAAIPLAAGGAILQSRMKDKQQGAANSDAELPAARDIDLAEGAEYEILPTTELPAPDFAAPDSAARAAVNDFTAYALARASALKAGETVPTALLDNPADLTPVRRQCGAGLPSVLVDIDPPGEVASFEPPWLPSRSLANGLAELRANGVAVFWISQNGPARASAMRGALVDSGLDPQGSDGLVLMRFPAERKQARRQDLGDTICLLAIAGGERSDFDELYDYLKQDGSAQPLEPIYGDGWFLIPPPLAKPPATVAPDTDIAEPETTPTEDDTDALEP